MNLKETIIQIGRDIKTIKNYFKNIIGEKNQLQTDNKDSIVNAINEVNTKATPSGSRTYEVSFNATGGATPNFGGGVHRGNLTYVPDSTIGIVHLDFSVRENKGSGFVIGTLPNDCPVSTTLIEIQKSEDGRTTIWLEGNSRVIKSNGLKANTRYIVDLIGFFR